VPSRPAPNLPPGWQESRPSCHQQQAGAARWSAICRPPARSAQTGRPRSPRSAFCGGGCPCRERLGPSWGLLLAGRAVGRLPGWPSRGGARPWVTCSTHMPFARGARGASGRAAAGDRWRYRRRRCASTCPRARPGTRQTARPRGSWPVIPGQAGACCATARSCSRTGARYSPVAGHRAVVARRGLCGQGTRLLGFLL